MKVLVVSDLHYSLKQFDWLVANAPPYDLVVIAGDLMELGSYVDLEIQAAVVERYFRKLCEHSPMVVCSGNHDLIEEGEGERSAEWLSDLGIDGLVVDCGSYEVDGLRILSLPWWEGDRQRRIAGDWLAAQYQRADPGPVFWVNHAPAKGTKTGWNGKRDLGDPWISERIAEYSPALVLTGHVHNAPYYPEGSWIDRIGETVVTNGGRQTGGIPATIEVEVEGGEMIWCGMEGCQRGSFRIA